MKSGPEAVEVENMEIAVVSSSVVKEEQKVLWRDKSEHWSERRSFMKLRSAPRESRGGVERSVSGGRKRILLLASFLSYQLLFVAFILLDLIVFYPNTASFFHCSSQ